MKDKGTKPTKETTIMMLEHEEADSGDKIELITPREVAKERVIKTNQGKVFKRRKTQTISAKRRITQSQVKTFPASRKSKVDMEKEVSSWRRQSRKRMYKISSDPKELVKYIIDIGLVGKIDPNAFVNLIETDKKMVEDLLIRNFR